MFDDVFRGFEVAPFGLASPTLDGLGWPQIDIEETEKEVRITAELPGLDERDVSVEIANGVLSISGEKNQSRGERYYGRFERRIPLEEDKVSAAFKNGVLSIKVAKSAERKNVRRIVTVMADTSVPDPSIEGARDDGFIAAGRDADGQGTKERRGTAPDDARCRSPA